MRNFPISDAGRTEPIETQVPAYGRKLEALSPKPVLSEVEWIRNNYAKQRPFQMGQLIH